MGEPDGGQSPRVSAEPEPDPERPHVPLGELYRKHADFVWRCLRRFGIPDEIREDVVHEVFMIVQRRLPSFDGRAAHTTWLYGIARGVAANVRRGRSRAQARARLVPVEVPSFEDPERSAERTEALACVAAFLSELDPDQREVFELVDIEGLSGPEVAELLVANVNVVYSRLRLARRKFEAFIDTRVHPYHPTRRPRERRD